MTDPLSFPDATPRFHLPLLFVGQAQKEPFVNEALTRLDILLHGRVQGQASVPPASPAAGECWLVGTEPAGAWEGEAGSIAGWAGTHWMFAAPLPGMQVWDDSRQAFLTFSSSWTGAQAPSVPAGGTVIDSEARAAIASLVNQLRQAGFLAPA